MSSEAQTEANTILGTSVPAAIAIATVFFIAGLVGIGNLLYTRRSGEQCSWNVLFVHVIEVLWRGPFADL